MAFTPGWQLQPRGVNVPLLVDGGPEVDGQRSLLGLGGRRQQRGDFEGSCNEKIETEEWFEDDDAEEESSDEEEEDGEDEDDKS